MCEYKGINGYSGYRVGDDGTVWSSLKKVQPHNGACWAAGDTWKELKYRPNRTGYLRVVLYQSGKSKARMIHHLVLEAFVGPAPEGMYACHGNDIKTDNRLINLRWDTPEANWNDRHKNGRFHPAAGERSGMTKLSRLEVIGLRNRAANGEWASKLAKEFGISHSTARNIITGRTWSSVPEGLTCPQ